ncbi:MAG: hypothetical protein O2985_15805 [Proteobacteria bacterium]|nr:hypothetical protein [Pseudomonadota bacterium]
MSDTQSTEPGGPAVNIVLDADCRDLFVDGVGGAMVRDGVVRLNLVNTRYDFHGAAVEHAVVARLIMSRSGARNLQTALSQLASRMPQDGSTATATASVTPVPESPTPARSAAGRARSRAKK